VTPSGLYYAFPALVLGSGSTIGELPGTPSATLNFPWHKPLPQPLQKISYMRLWLRTGADLVQQKIPSLTPIKEKLISARAVR